MGLKSSLSRSSFALAAAFFSASIALLEELFSFVSFLAAGFFALAFLATDFLAVAFLAVAFLAAVFLALAFLVTAFLTGAFLAAAFEALLEAEDDAFLGAFLFVFVFFALPEVARVLLVGLAFALVMVVFVAVKIVWR